MSNPKVDLIVGNLTSAITDGLDRAQAFYALVAFVRSSGIVSLLPKFRRFVDAGGEIKLLTGDYLYVTEPDALSQLYALGPQLEARLWQSDGRSFHPKAYLFDDGDQSEVIIGSSNLSLSGLTSGVEWNLRAVDQVFPNLDPFAEFLRLFYDEATVPINPVTIARYRHDRALHGPAPAPLAMSDAEDTPILLPEDFGPGQSLRRARTEDPTSPREAQAEALRALMGTRDEGFQRGLVVLPTGLGKTFLAAFFAKTFRRVLFVAHREEILLQAEATFRTVMPERTAAQYDGRQQMAADLTFASVYTLSAKRHRERFSPDAFDLIVIDEFHHAAARSYEALMAYFTPTFLLGLTATPDRSDHKDVYALCDGNLVYHLTLEVAIEREWLSPFRYYAVYDPIDYTQLTWRTHRYDEWELTRAQLDQAYGDAVVAAWQKYHGQRTLVFCSSRAQSQFLAQQFIASGIRARHVDGTTPRAERQASRLALASGEIDALCSVDLFNEGVDLPTVDTVLLARPSDSMVVFLQQIGRGLRLAPGKSHCTIIDLVGNYHQVDQRLSALGVPSLAVWAHAHTPKPSVPKGCEIRLEFAVIDLLQRLKTHVRRRHDWLKDAYRRVKEDLGRTPSYLEFHLQSGVDSTWIRQRYHSYVGFLLALDELDDQAQSAFQQCQGWLEVVERTPLQKSYKMVLLKVAVDRGIHWSQPISADEAALPFYQYLHEARYRQADCESQSVLAQPFSARAVASLISSMPMHHLAQTGAPYFGHLGHQLSLDPGVDQRWLGTAQRWTAEVIEYRLHRYFYRHPAPDLSGR